MKRFLTIMTAACLLCACEKAPTVITDDSPEYTGKMVVVYEGDNFEQTGIKVLGEFNEDITPWAMGGPYETYRVDDLHGTITENSIEFSLGFYNTKKQENYPTTYSGSL